MADPQVERLNQQIAEYKNRTELEKKKYNEISQKVRELYQQSQTLSQQKQQNQQPQQSNEATADPKKFKSEFENDKELLKDGYAYIEYERFKQEIGDIQKPADLNNLLNTAASFLIQFNEPMPRLVAQREKKIEKCQQLESEILATQNDIKPISQQAEKEIKDYRQEQLTHQNKINYLQIDRINKRLQHFSDRYTRETEISKLEGRIASSQTTYAYQNAALNGLQYISSLIKDGAKQFTPDQISQIKSHMDNLNNIFTFKDKEQYEKDLTKISKAVKKLNKSKKEAITKINEVLSGFNDIAQLELSINNEINTNKTSTNMSEFGTHQVTNEIKRLEALNSTLDSEIVENGNDADQLEAENSKLEQEIRKSEEYRGKTEKDMAQIEKQLKEKQESKEKLLEEHKSLENEYQKSSNEFLNTLAQIAKANKSPELQKSNDNLTSMIKNINSRMSEIRNFEDIEMPLNTFLLDDAKQELEEIRKSTEQQEIQNVQLIYNSQPYDMFNVIKIPTLTYYIVKTAHIKLAFDALFYPNNIDPLYPCTLVVATILGNAHDISLLASSIIALINSSIKSNAANIDPNTKGLHSAQDMVKNFDKTHPYQFNKLLPYIKESPLTSSDVINKGLNFLICLAKVYPIPESMKGDVKNMLDLVDESNENSKALKSLLDLNIDPKAAAKKKRSTVNLKEDKIISLNSAVSVQIIDDKDRKQDIPITKSSMSIKEKDLDRISYIDEKTLSDQIFYELFTYTQFNPFQKLSAVDLIKNKNSAYFEEMTNLRETTIQFIKNQLNQNQTKKGGKSDDLIVGFKRWLRMANMSLARNNLFFFNTIIKALDKYKTLDEKVTNDLSDSEELKIWNEIKKYFNESEVENKLNDVKKNSINGEKLKNWFYIPSFDDKTSSISILKNLLKEKDDYAVKNFKLQTKYIRDIAECVYFCLGAINNKFAFNLNPDVVRGLEKRLEPSTEG